MCPTPTPVYDFGQIIMDHLVNQQYELVNDEIERFRKKGYIVYYKRISKEEYESSDFIENAGKIMHEAKETSKGWHFNGILVLFPFINKKNYESLFNHNIPSIFLKNWGILFEWSTHFNENLCLGNPIINKSDVVCQDRNIYLMVFYFKGGLNWK